MLYALARFLETEFDLPGAGLFQFITFRAGMAIIISLVISIIFGGSIIRWLRRMQVGEKVRDLGLEGQKEKEGTPTMGGIIIILAIVVPCVLLARLENVYIQLMLLATLWMGAIGFVDDYIKTFRRNKDGLSGKFKVLGQIGLGLIVGLSMLLNDGVVVRMDAQQARARGYEMVETFEIKGRDGQPRQVANVRATLTDVPFVKESHINYQAAFSFLGKDAELWGAVFFVLFVIFIIAAVSNAANLTDGIDGLATGVSGIVGVTLGVFAYVSGNAIAADYLNILYLPGTGELVVFAACFLGACIGFLWYNAYPAQVFMGDTGSLMLGGIIGAMAIVLRKELLLPLLCGIFVAENLSVIIQVWYFKYTKQKYGQGRRVFLMAPLHHHFQKMGLPEPKIVTRFWIVAILLAVFTVLTLKIR